MQDILFKPEALFFISIIIFLIIYQLLKVHVKFSNKVLSYPIKRFLPELKDILNKYDGTNSIKVVTIRQDSNTLIKEEKNIEIYEKKFGYPKLMLGTYLMIDILIILLIIKFIFTFFPDKFDIHFNSPHALNNNELVQKKSSNYILLNDTIHIKKNPPNQDIIRDKNQKTEDIHGHSMVYEILLHIDIGGILTGILGIIIALLIAIVVEDGNKKNDEELKGTIEQISNGVEKDLKGKMIEILNSNSTLLPKNSLPERIESFNNIIKLAIENKNDCEIYSINYSGDFGFLRTHNLDVILQYQSKRFDNLSEINQKDFFFMYEDIKRKNNTVKESLNVLLKTFNGNYENLHFAIMNLNQKNKHLKSTFEAFLEKVLEGTEICIYDSLENKKFDFDLDLVKRSNKVYYFFPKSQIKNYNAKKTPKENIIKYLYNNSSEKVSDFGLPAQSIIQLDRIPFQFIVCKSKSGKTPSKALVSFTNVDAIGDNGGMFGFESIDSKIIASLVEIYKNYEKGQIEKNSKSVFEYERIKIFQDIFEINKEKLVKTIIKYKEIKEKEKEFYQVVPKSDIIAAVNFRDIFQEVTDIYPNPSYQLYERPEVLCSSKQNCIYLVIGLFASEDRPQTVAEWLGHFNNTKFELIRKSPDFENKNTIIITDNEGNKSNYSEIWSEDNNQDYALLAKIKRENAIYFICGGLNHFGTEKMSEYFKKHWQSFYEFEDQNDSDKKVENNEFLMFYKFSSKNNEKEYSSTKILSIIN